MAHYIHHHNSLVIPQDDIISTQIYAVNGQGLGDCWASVNYLLRQSEQSGKAIKLSTWYYSENGMPRDVKENLEEIIPLINSQGKIILTEEENTNQLTPEQIFQNQYFPSHIRWKDNIRKYFGYQFDGKSHKKFVNMSKEDENKILKFIEDNGYKPRKIGGGEMNIRECVRIAAECKYFIGVDSGISHLCYSIGTPVNILLNKRNKDQFLAIHGTKKFTLFQDADDFITNFKLTNNASNRVL